MTKTSSSRFMSIFLPVCIILMCIPGMSVTAYAATYQTDATVNFHDLQIGDVLESGVPIAALPLNEKLRYV